MASQNLNVGTAANANDGDTLRAAFIKVKQMFAEVYGQTYSEQGDLSGVTFEIKEDKLKATNTAVDGYVLTYDSGTGGFTWEQKFDGDITSIVAGAGLTGSSLDADDATLNVIGGDGITVNADDVALASSVAGSGLTYTNGVLSVDSIGTDGITNDAVTPQKVNLLADDLAATDTHIMIADGTDFSNFEMSGDATLSNAGLLTIGNDKITYAKLGARFTAADTSITAAADTEIDFDDASVYSFTSAIAVDLRFENEQIGDVKTIIVTASGSSSSLTFDTGTNTVTKLNGTYDATASAVNFIQVVCTASNTFFVTISQ